jgi:uracil-DNA glycosylase family 4
VKLELQKLLKKIENCCVCAHALPFKPNPVVRASTSARLLIIGQAPGTKVQQTGIPWNDRSGDRLRSWLNLEKEQFYNRDLIAITPMGFCYPGVDKNGGDKPPRSECAPLWHADLRNLMPNIQLTLLVGAHAQKYYLGEKRKATMGETVRAWKEYLPHFIPLPHPSWRNTAWLHRNPWFDSELIPELRHYVSAVACGFIPCK